jgi:hypothetical protein
VPFGTDAFSIAAACPTSTPAGEEIVSATTADGAAYTLCDGFFSQIVVPSNISGSFDVTQIPGATEALFYLGAFVGSGGTTPTHGTYSIDNVYNLNGPQDLTIVAMDAASDPLAMRTLAFPALSAANMTFDIPALTSADLVTQTATISTSAATGLTATLGPLEYKTQNGTNVPLALHNATQIALPPAGALTPNGVFKATATATGPSGQTETSISGALPAPSSTTNIVQPQLPAVTPSLGPVSLRVPSASSVFATPTNVEAFASLTSSSAPHTGIDVSGSPRYLSEIGKLDIPDLHGLNSAFTAIPSGTNWAWNFTMVNCATPPSSIEPFVLPSVAFQESTALGNLAIP